MAVATAILGVRRIECPFRDGTLHAKIVIEHESGRYIDPHRSKPGRRNPLKLRQMVLSRRE
jgi:hypothetical protein